jgi:hypothetical protein
MSGWRKRTIMEMALEAGFEGCAELTWENVICTEELERFEALVRADEREQIAQWYDTTGHVLMRHEVPDAIRARGQA